MEVAAEWEQSESDSVDNDFADDDIGDEVELCSNAQDKLEEVEVLQGGRMLDSNGEEDRSEWDWWGSIYCEFSYPAAHVPHLYRNEEDFPSSCIDCVGAMMLTLEYYQT